MPPPAFAKKKGATSINEADHREVMVITKQLLLSPHGRNVKWGLGARFTGPTRPATCGY